MTQTRNLPSVTMLVLTFFLVSSLTCCGGKGESDMKETNPYTLYQMAMDSLETEKYGQAAKYFEQIEIEHPASDLAPDSQVRRAFALYEAGEYNSVPQVTDDFVKLYPTHKEVPYMLYLRAASYYDQIVDVGRDQHLTELAQSALEELITRFPHSEYTRNARVKLDFANSSLAGKEMEVGRFYLQNQRYFAALNRFKVVVEKYQTSMFITEALYRLVEVNSLLGLNDEAIRYASVLGHNYPNSSWYEMAYNLVTKGQSAEEQSVTKQLLKKIW